MCEVEDVSTACRMTGENERTLLAGPLQESVQVCSYGNAVLCGLSRIAPTSTRPVVDTDSRFLGHIRLDPGPHRRRKPAQASFQNYRWTPGPSAMDMKPMVT